MKQLPSRLRRLDGALADLPLEEPMLLSELDGFLTGLLVSPEAVPAGEWMSVVWGTDDGGVAAFEDPLDVQWFAEAVMAHRREIERDLTRGRPRPLFDVDERTGETLWDAWLDGFGEAMALRPDLWDALADSDDAATAAAMAGLSRLFSVADEESGLDSVEINALHDRAPAEIVAFVARLHAARTWREAASAVAETSATIGRNDPCACGSGRKSKRCCG